jgi:hypothetical protein
LLHVARGDSLRETVVRARMARLAKVSEVALLKRLRSAEEWFHALGGALLQEQGIEMPQAHPQLRLRLVEGTTIEEPGKTGSWWRVHYSFRIPEFHCAAFTLPPQGGRHGRFIDAVPDCPRGSAFVRPRSSSGTGYAGKGNWPLSASSRSRSSAPCLKRTSRVPGPGSPANSSSLS